MRKVLLTVRDRDGHLRTVGVIINRNVFDIGQIVKIELELLLAKGSQFGAHVFMGEMTEWFYVGAEIQSLSLCFSVENRIGWSKDLRLLSYQLKVEEKENLLLMFKV